MIQERTLLPGINLNARELGCLAFAVAVHSLLFLWKGGLLTMPNTQENLGDMLVQVDFMSEVPNFDDQAGGGSGPKPEGLLQKMKAMIKGEKAAGPEPVAKIAEPAPAPQAAETPKLVNKEFTPKAVQKGFQGMTEKADDMNVAVGQTKTVEVVPSKGDVVEAAPNLKEKAFKVSAKEMPFKIASTKNQEILANTNQIPMVVGNTTSESVKSLDGGAGAGPALQSKTFASKGKEFSPGKSGGFGSPQGNSDSGLMSMGGGAGSTAQAASVGGGGGMGGEGGGGSGYGSGHGSGQGTGVGSGNGNGNGGGRAWGGSGTRGGMSSAPLARNTVTETISSGSEKIKADSGYSITGDLANSPVLKKSRPPYEMDARVALRFRVDWSGKVLDGVLVEISSGSPSFDQKVIAALKMWVFSMLPAHRSNEIQEGVITFLFKGV